MSYCINPWCLNRENPDDQEFCQSCGSTLVINERYRVIKPLRELNQNHHTEIFEIDNLGKTKVLKVLTSNRRRLIEMFEQEASILRHLRYLSVPQIDTCFCFSPKDRHEQLYCLVMEKIPGDNLAHWIDKNGRLSEELAINWLMQLTKLLVELHQEKVLHRDIKPSNIMIRPDGKLLFIDFGAARQVTMTYAEKLDGGDITRVYSLGYTAPEQIQGQASYQSDYFALGRTFVNLLTGIHPNDLPKEPHTNRIIWREQAPQISSGLANFIDNLMIPAPDERLLNPQLVLEQIHSNQSQELQISELSAGKKNLSLSGGKILAVNNLTNIWHNLCKVMAVSVAIAFCVIGIRYFGILQPWELHSFDRLMAIRPIEKPDPRLLLVTIDEADIQYQNSLGMQIRWSLSDQALLQLIEKLEPYQPRTIGLDIYRDFPVSSDYPQLANYLRTDTNFFAPCKVAAPKDDAPNAVPPPPEVPESRLGFSDFVADNDEVARRHLLYLTPPANSACTAQYAFSLQTALHYLANQGINTNVTSDGQLQIGQVVFPQLKSHSSGYQNIDASGYQILLNYRSLRSPQDIAQQLSLRDILENRVTPELINALKNRVVLIGVTAPSTVDQWKTPYSATAIRSQKNIPGIFIQAQAIAQIFSAVLDNRPLIWWWPTWLEALWMIGWSFLAGILALCIRRPLYLGVTIAIALLLLFSICYLTFINAGWIPIIPPAILIITVPAIVVWLNSTHR
ncbi:CHASE2 domain-containing protein [Nostoc sp. FACHB-87]|uniref:CHASE2 domain-containing protein n=1 Tax=Nostocaceae TaxID=1162 RepID=UPI0016852835|nr:MULTISPECIES: CHASE2 domain-containing protein [Nostocaceae]MBD2457460.1 CHASE2 domain-containing protein [Nostoc sp. FACHB-87]MBD2477572.1 CHASE2 domain-containing protein [Anabaena sp. FACHB-83]